MTQEPKTIEDINWDKMIEEAKTLPRGKEMWIGHRYIVLLHCIGARDRLWFWQTKQKKFYDTVILRAL